MNPKYEIREAIPNFTTAKYGLVAGPLFSLIFGTLVLFTGSLADKFNRRYLLGSAAVCWSLTSLGTAATQNFAEIAILRMMLGLFESCCAPAAYSLIADYFPPEIRTTANAYFAGCIFVGTALSSVSTIMVVAFGWRITYLIVGIYGVIAGILVLTFITEPMRGRFDPAKVEEEIII
jgi:MFS family permease